MSTEDDMWRDYDHYMHTGELSEYFEEEYEEEEYVRDNSGDGITDAYCKDLDDVIRYLEKLKKENERIIKEEKKKEKAQKKSMAQKKSAVKKNEPTVADTKSEKQETVPKTKTIDNTVFYIIMFALMVLFLFLIAFFV